MIKIRHFVSIITVHSVFIHSFFHSHVRQYIHPPNLTHTRSLTTSALNRYLSLAVSLGITRNKIAIM